MRVPKKLRDTWYVDLENDTVCIWCERFASLCVIENPCVRRERYEAALKISKSLDFSTT